MHKDERVTDVMVGNITDEQIRFIADAKDVATCRSRIRAALSALVEDQPVAVKEYSHDDRVALAGCLSWDLNDISPRDVGGILDRLLAEGYRLTRVSALTPAPAGEDVVEAARRYVDAVNGEPEKDCWDTEDGKEAPGAARFASDWAWQEYDAKKQAAFDALRAALSRKGVDAC